METVQKYPEVKLEILPMDFFQTCQETKSPNRTHEKKSGSKVSNFVHGKISQKIRQQNLKILLMKILHFFGRCSAKNVWNKLPKKQTKLLSVVIKNKQVVISCYRVVIMSGCQLFWQKKCPF